MSVDYRTYMASDDWARRRVAALERSIHSVRGSVTPRCEICHRPGQPFKNRVEDRRFRIADSNGLNVHHLHYRHLGNEEPDDLIVLCTDDLFFDDYHRAYAAWRRATLLGQPAGPEPELPEGVGCHERVHADRGFRTQVFRLAQERTY
jgi:hypothetical protein